MVSCSQEVSCPIPLCSPAMAGGSCPFSLQEQRVLQGSCWSYLPRANFSFFTCLCRLSHFPGILPRICMRLCHLDWEGSCQEKGQRLFIEKHITPTPYVASKPSPPTLGGPQRSCLRAQGQSPFLAWPQATKIAIIIRQTRMCMWAWALGWGMGYPSSESFLCVRGCVSHMTSCHLHNIQ